jgi:hypothetical protein
MEPSTYAVCQAAKWLKSSWKGYSANFAVTAFSAKFGRNCHHSIA